MKDKRKRVTIISRESNERTLDVAMLEAELLRRGVEVKVLSRLLTKDRSLRALGYAGHVLKQEAAILASDVVVLDTYCIPASMIPHRGGTKVVQMWHALGAVKKFGWQTVGKEGGSSERVASLMKMHRRYDYVVCPSYETARYFCEAFDTEPEKIVKYGLPRIDYIKSVSAGSRREDMRKKIFAKYPSLSPDAARGSALVSSKDAADDGDADGYDALRRAYDALHVGERKTILYAPTFRRGKTVDAQSLIDAVGRQAPGRYDIVVKLHPLYRGTGTAANDAAKNVNVIYDETFSSYDWLSVADIVISDYSSFVIESTLADKPLFIYAYDLDEYELNTGLNMDFAAEPVAPYVFKDAGELAKTIDETCRTAADDAVSGQGSSAGAYDFGALHAFRDRYIDIETGNGPASGGVTENYCTAALADFIISLIR